MKFAVSLHKDLPIQGTMPELVLKMGIGSYADHDVEMKLESFVESDGNKHLD